MAGMTRMSAIILRHIVFLPLALLPALAGAQVSIPPIQAVPSVASPVAPATQPVALRFSWAADHPSGVYFAKDEAKLSLLIDNTTSAALPLEGNVTFGRIDSGTFTPISITPITPVSINPGRRVRLEIPATFGLPATYALRVNDQLVPGVFDLPLVSRFPPQAAENTIAWSANLPPQAGLIDGFLVDYAARTGIRRFVVHDALAADPPAFLKLLPEAKKAKLDFVWHITLPIMANVDASVAAHLSKYVDTVMKDANGVITGIAVDPWLPKDRAMDPAEYRACYLAIYQAAKKADPHVTMLGTTWAVATRRLLLDPKDAMRPYVDAVASSGDRADFVVATQLDKPLTPERVWLLPKADGGCDIPVPVALAAGLRTLPVPPEDHGITVHVFGGTVLLQRVRPETPPYVVVFQGNGYSVAAIAGIGAGTTPLDAEWPHLAKSPGATLEVMDENREMRLVDATGNVLERKTGDLFAVPLDGSMWYLIAPTSAEETAALLRRAPAQGLAVAEVTGGAVHATDAGPELVVRVRNALLDEKGGAVRVLRGDKEVGVRELVAISPGKTVEVNVPVEGPVEAGDELTVEVRLGDAASRQRMVVGK